MDDIVILLIMYQVRNIYMNEFGRKEQMTSSLQHVHLVIYDSPIVSPYPYFLRHTGALVVTEILHRLCLWHHHGEADAEKDVPKREGHDWWDYISYYDLHCRDFWRDPTASDKLQHCTQEAYKFAGIKGDEIESCMKDSGGLDEDHPNEILEAQLVEKENYGILVTPVVWASGRTLHWEPPTAKTILYTICEEYNIPASSSSSSAPAVKIPDICKQCMMSNDNHNKNNYYNTNDDDIVQCAEKHGGASKSAGGGQTHRKHHGVWVAFWVVAAAAMATSLGYFGYQKVLERMGPQDPTSSRAAGLTEGLRYALLSDRNSPDSPASGHSETVTFSAPGGNLG